MYNVEVNGDGEVPLLFLYLYYRGNYLQQQMGIKQESYSVVMVFLDETQSAVAAGMGTGLVLKSLRRFLICPLGS